MRNILLLFFCLPHSWAVAGVYRNGTKYEQTTIRTCWKNAVAGDRMLRGQPVRALVQETITEQYARAGIHFVGWEPCDPSQELKGVVKIMLQDAWPLSRANCKDMGNAPDNWCLQLNFHFKEWPGQCESKDWRSSWACICSQEEFAENCIKSYALHEFGHVLGLAHEAEHPESNCEQGRIRQKVIALTPYDPLSIMNYCQNKMQIESNEVPVLSEGDINTIERLYDPRTPVVIPPDWR